MSYVDYEYYKNTFKGQLDEDTARKLLDEASDDVDKMTYGRIRKREFDNLSDFQKDKIKKAICYQAEFNGKYSEYLNMPLSGFSAGDISMSFNDENKTAVGIIADRRTIDLLSQTGLTVRRL